MVILKNTILLCHGNPQHAIQYLIGLIVFKLLEWISCAQSTAICNRIKRQTINNRFFALQPPPKNFMDKKNCFFIGEKVPVFMAYGPTPVKDSWLKPMTIYSPKEPGSFNYYSILSLWFFWIWSYLRSDSILDPFYFNKSYAELSSVSMIMAIPGWPFYSALELRQKAVRLFSSHNMVYPCNRKDALSFKSFRCPFVPHVRSLSLREYRDDPYKLAPISGKIFFKTS